MIFEMVKSLRKWGTGSIPQFIKKALRLEFGIMKIKVSNPQDAKEAWAFIGSIKWDVTDLFHCILNKDAKFQFAVEQDNSIQGSPDEAEKKMIYDRSNLILSLCKKGFATMEYYQIAFKCLSVIESLQAFVELNHYMKQRASWCYS